MAMLIFLIQASPTEWPGRPATANPYQVRAGIDDPEYCNIKRQEAIGILWVAVSESCLGELNVH